MSKTAKTVVRPCHGVGAYAEGLYVVAEAPAPGKTWFGFVPTCKKCFKAMGEPELEGKPPKGWSATSWALMLETHPHAPFNFARAAAGHLLPETYKGPAPARLQPPVTGAQALEVAEAGREGFSEEPEERDAE